MAGTGREIKNSKKLMHYALALPFLDPHTKFGGNPSINKKALGISLTHIIFSLSVAKHATIKSKLHQNFGEVVSRWGEVMD